MKPFTLPGDLHRRRVEKFGTAGWVSCDLSELRPGDRFRMFDQDVPIVDPDGTSEWVALKLPFKYRDIWGIQVTQKGAP